MSTRSTVSVQIGDKVHAVYGHWDGYPEYVGRMLLEHYNSQEKAEAIVALGSFSQLRETLDCPEGHSYETPHEGCSVFYGRDRGEKNVNAKVFSSIDSWKENAAFQDFNYFWDGKKWTVDGKTLTKKMCGITRKK